MKTKIPLICLLLPCLSLPADVLTVDNNSGSVAMYTSTTTAYNDAVDGDTILIAGSPSAYSSLNCYKQLTFIGPGWFLLNNGVPGLTNNLADVNITFKKDVSTGDSSGSIARGISGQYIVDSSVTGITIDKCYSAGHDWTINGEATITRCYHINTLVLNGTTSSVFNCLIRDLQLNNSNTTASQCIIYRDINTVTLSFVSNTIFTFPSGANFDSDASFSFCMSIGGTYLPSGNNNINGQIFATVFVNTGSFDALYQLASGSPAANAGLNGDDMGMYGGSTPYVPSGVPGIPRLTQLVVPATATDTSGLRFEVSAEAFPE